MNTETTNETTETTETTETMTLEQLEAAAATLAKQLSERRAEAAKAARAAAEQTAWNRALLATHDVALDADGVAIVSPRNTSQNAPQTRQTATPRAATAERPFVSERSGRVSYMTDGERKRRARIRRVCGRDGVPYENSACVAAMREHADDVAAIAAMRAAIAAGIVSA